MLKKLKDFIERNRLIHSGSKVGLAVSGGPDSMCMLHLFAQLKAEYSIDITVLHFNHKLRRESDAEERFVADAAASLGFGFISDSFDVALFAREKRLSLEDAARRKRYEFFELSKDQFGFDRIALAHTLDDLAETFVMNVIRGSTLRGLVSLRPLRSFYIRPMLCLTKQEIVDFLRSESIGFVVDKSNADRSFVRNRLRHELMGELKKFNPSIERTIFRSVMVMKDEESLLEDLTRVEMVKRVKFTGRYATVEMDGMHIALKRRVISEVVKRILNSEYSLGFENIERIVTLQTGKRVVLRKLLVAHRQGNRLVVERIGDGRED